jgi:hypothetical protein
MQTINVTKGVFLVPIACFVCSAPTLDAVFRGGTVVPVCSKHPDGVKRAQVTEEQIGRTAEVHA